jgi:hypothetical protein
MTAGHSASLGPSVRKPKKEWAPQGEEKARIEAMLEKCRKHVEPKVEVMPVESRETVPDAAGAASAENTPVPQLIWHRTSSHEMTSGCQRYKVQKTTIQHLMTEKGKATSTHAWRYQCHVRVEWLWYVHLEALQASFAAAQEVCEAHLREKAAA